MSRPAVFLDRDGVLCEDRADYVKSWAEWRWVPGAIEGAATLARAGRRLVVITNQACVGKGLVSQAALDEIHFRMSSDLAAAGAPLAGIYVCPHTEENGCSCRKPKPGLLMAAERELRLDTMRSVFVGDNLRDRDAALAANVGQFILCLTGQGKRWAAEAVAKGFPVLTAPDLQAAARLILAT